jgi:hypothetical protein
MIKASSKAACHSGHMAVFSCMGVEEVKASPVTSFIGWACNNHLAPGAGIYAHLPNMLQQWPCCGELDCRLLLQFRDLLSTLYKFQFDEPITYAPGCRAL